MSSGSCSKCSCAAYNKNDKKCSCGHSKKSHVKEPDEAPAPVAQRLALARSSATKDDVPGLPFALTSQPRDSDVRPSASYATAYSEAKVGLKSNLQSGRFKASARGRGKGRGRSATQSKKLPEPSTASKRSSSRTPSISTKKEVKEKGKVRICTPFNKSNTDT